MSNVAKHEGRTVADQSFQFGSVPVPAFDAQSTPAVVHSVVVGFDFVRPLMSGKPIQGRRRALAHPRKCVVYVTREDDGQFSAVSAELPGVASCGDTEREALANVREAFDGVIRYYKDNGIAVPWLDQPEAAEPGAKPVTVLVYG